MGWVVWFLCWLFLPTSLGCFGPLCEFRRTQANSDSGQRKLLTSKGHVLADHLGSLVKGDDFRSIPLWIIYVTLSQMSGLAIRTDDQGLSLSSCSVVSDPLWPHGLRHTRLPVPHRLPELAQSRVHRAGAAIQPSRPLSPLLLLSDLPSIRVFSVESAIHVRWPKYWNFGFSIGPSDESSRLISFRIDWLDV